MTWKNYPIYQREDKSFVIVMNEAPYHVPNEGKWQELYAEVAEFYVTNETVRAKKEIEYSDLHPELEQEIPEPTPEEKEAALQRKYTRFIQGILDAEAYKLGYTGVGETVEGACMSVCSYVDTGVVKFDDEGRAFRAWRSAVWAMCYEILDEVKSGLRDIPSEDELLQLIPKLVIEYTS